MQKARRVINDLDYSWLLKILREFSNTTRGVNPL